MASFADTLPQFNPYVQQLPVDAMVKVGMYKQEKYDQGVQRIQSQIDKVAGLEISKDSDKAYLQSKLNELGGNLNIVAAGDFSNFQLVNSVGGMIGKIGKDENIRNAVISTAHDKKEYEILEQDRKNGKLSPSNEYNYLRKRQKWLNNNNVGELFSDRYVPNFDIDKHVAETFNKIKPDGYSTYEIFQTDSDGNVLYETDPKTGQKMPILSTTMAEKKKKDIFPEKVAEVLERVFDDPRVQQQLQIDGEYNYRGYSPEQLSQKVISSRSAEMTLYNNQIGELNIKKTAASTEEEKAKLQDQIDKITAKKKSSLSNFESLLSSAYINPDAVRGALQINDARTSFIGMYTSIETEETLKENPAWRAQFDMQKEANDMAIKQADLAHKWATYGQAERRLQWEMSKATRDELDLRTPTPSPRTTDVDPVAGFEQKGAILSTQMNGSVTKLLFESGIFKSKEVEDYKRTHPGATNEEAREAVIATTAKLNGESVEGFKTRWFTKTKEWLLKNPSKLTPDVRGTLVAAENAQKAYSVYLDDKRAVDAQAPLPDIARGLKTFTIPNPFSPKETINLTPQMQYDIALAYEGDDQLDSKELRQAAKAAQKRLEAQGITKDTVSVIASTYKWAGEGAFNLGRTFGAVFEGAPAMQTNRPEFLSFAALIRGIDKKENEQAYERRAEAVKKFYQLEPDLTMGFKTGKEEVDKRHYSDLASVVGTYIENDGKNMSPGFKDNAKNIMKIIVAGPGGKGGIDVRASKNENTGEIVPVFTFTDEEGEKVGEMTTTLEQAAAVGMDVSQWWADPKLRETQQIMARIGNGTTAYGSLKSSSTYTYEIPAFTKSDFQFLGGIKQDVRGHIQETTMIENGMQYPIYYNYLYINDDGKEYIKIFDVPRTSLQDAVNAFTNMNPALVSTIIREEQAKQTAKPNTQKK